MEKIYYSPRGYWKGYAAVEKLAKATGVNRKEARRWLEKQPVWQIHLPRPIYIPQARFDVDTPNKVHQADLLFLPHDKGYKYALTVIDVASRYKDAQPLKSKQASEVAKAFEKIYSRSLKFPETLMVDPGKEFMGEVKKLMNAKGTSIRLGRVEIHKDQALVERFNKTLAGRLFGFQSHKELDTGRVNREWAKRLPAVIKALNEERARLIGMSPADAIKLKSVQSKPSTPYHRLVGKEERLLPLGTTVRYLYELGEAEGDGRQRATDPIWSMTTHTIEKVLVKPNQPALYYISEGKRGYVREELQVIL